MSRFGLLAAAACAVLVGILTSPAHAEEAAKKDEATATKPQVSWSFAELRYVYRDVDDADAGPFEQGHGVGLDLSVEAFKYFHLAASYKWVDLEDEDNEEAPSLTDFFVGPGAHYNVLDCAGLFLNLGYAYRDADFSGDAVEDDGVWVRSGARVLLMKNAEIGAAADFADFDGDARWMGLFDVRYYLEDNLALAASVDYDDDEVITFTTGLRFDWGRKQK